MHRAIVAIMLCCAISTTAFAQVFAGDSLRVRAGRDSAWKYGRLLGQDGSAFTLHTGPDTVRVPIANLQRVDRWKRNHASWILAIASVGMLAAELGYNAQTPSNERNPSAYWTYGLGGAAGGAAMGLIAFSIWPGQWRVVFDR